MGVFLTGATGCIGPAVLDAFPRAGHAVTGLVRNSEKAAGEHDVIIHAGFASMNSRV